MTKRLRQTNLLESWMMREQPAVSFDAQFDAAQRIYERRSWAYLIEDLRGVIRKLLDNDTAQCLAWTCRAEWSARNRKIPNLDRYVYWPRTARCTVFGVMERYQKRPPRSKFLSRMVINPWMHVLDMARPGAPVVYVGSQLDYNDLAPAWAGYLTKVGKRTAHIDITHVFNYKSTTSWQVGTHVVEPLWALGLTPMHSLLEREIKEIVARERLRPSKR